MHLQLCSIRGRGWKRFLREMIEHKNIMMHCRHISLVYLLPGTVIPADFVLRGSRLNARTPLPDSSELPEGKLD